MSLYISPDNTINDQFIQYQKKINSNKYNERGEV